MPGGSHVHRACFAITAEFLAGPAIVAGTASAQDYPSEPIVLLVPFAAGGPTDIVARTLGQAIDKVLNQTIVVEIAVGAGGDDRAGQAQNSPPDGYTLLLAHIGMATAPALYRRCRSGPWRTSSTSGRWSTCP